MNANEQIHASNKRHSRLTDAKLAVKRADKYLGNYPAASASPVVRDLRLALQGLIDEVHGS